MPWLAQTLETDLKEEVHNTIDVWHTKYRVIKVRAPPSSWGLG